MVAPVGLSAAASSVSMPMAFIKVCTLPRCSYSDSRAAPVRFLAKVERLAAIAAETLISQRGQVPVSVELLGDG